MNETSQSNLSVSGFDGSQQPGRMQGWSHMYFMQKDPAYKDEDTRNDTRFKLPAERARRGVPRQNRYVTPRSATHYVT